MSENQNEQMTREQLDELEQSVVNGAINDLYFMHQLNLLQLITLARQGLQLREVEQKYMRDNSTLTAELTVLRKDKERLDWLDNVLKQGDIEIHNGSDSVKLRDNIDAAMKEKNV